MSTAKSSKTVDSRQPDIKSLLLILKAIAVATIFSIPIFLSYLRDLIWPPPLKNVSGQLALVTGGSAGIGKAIAVRLAREGCDIAIVNRNRDAGQRVADEIRTLFKVNAMAFKCDVSRHEDVKKLKRQVEESLGNVDILVNNAGLLSLERSIFEGDDEDYQRVVDANLMSYFWTTRAFLPSMIARKRGHIVSISSLSVKFPVFGAVAYTTTKFGNVGFMDALHEDLCFLGHDDYIKTTTVLPSIVATQPKLAQMVEAISSIPFADVDAVAESIVVGALRNRRKFIVPQSSALVAVVSWFPDGAVKRAKQTLYQRENTEKFLRIRSGGDGN